MEWWPIMSKGKTIKKVIFWLFVTPPLLTTQKFKPPIHNSHLHYFSFISQYHTEQLTILPIQFAQQAQKMLLLKNGLRKHNTRRAYYYYTTPMMMMSFLEF